MAENSSLGQELLRHRAESLSLWKEVRTADVGGNSKNLHEASTFEHRAQQLNNKLLDIYRALLDSRGVSLTSDTRCDEVAGEDERCLLLLIRFHEDVSTLAQIDLDNIESRHALSQSVPCERLGFSRSDDLRLVRSKHFREVMYNVHRFLELLVKCPTDFLGDLEQYLGEIEDRTLERWPDKFSPEKTLLVVILRAWHRRLEELQGLNQDMALGLLSLTPKISAQGQEGRRGEKRERREVRLVVHEQKNETLTCPETVIIGSSQSLIRPTGQEETRKGAWPTRQRVERISPRFARVRFWVSWEPCALATEREVEFTVKIRAPEWTGSCRVPLRQPGPVQDSPPGVEDWYQKEREDLLSSSEGKLILTVSGNRLSPYQLGAHYLKKTLEQEGVEVLLLADDRKIEAHLCKDKDSIWIYQASHFDHAAALRLLFEQNHNVKVWEATVAGFIRNRFPELGIEADAVELLEEYLRPIDDRRDVDRFIWNLSRQIESNGEWALTKPLVERTRRQTIQLVQIVKRHIEKLRDDRGGAVLRALHKAAEAQGGDAPNASVDFGTIAANLASSVPNLSEVLQRLCEVHGLIEPDGSVRSQRYRFANRLYFEAAGEVFRASREVR